MLAFFGDERDSEVCGGKGLEPPEKERVFFDWDGPRYYLLLSISALLGLAIRALRKSRRIYNGYYNFIRFT